MKIKKMTFDLIFILVFAAILITLLEFGLIVKYKGFLLVPILIAYQLGKYAERRSKNKNTDLN